MNRSILAWAVTAIWIVAWALYILVQWDQVLTMSPNEAGDFIAGLTAPLAFFWLVIGYFQQGEELRQNTRALEQQEKALQQQVQESKELVRVTSEQARSTIRSQQFEREIIIKNAQPNFAAAGHKFSAERVFLMLKNIGHKISKVRVSMMGEISIDVSEIQYWESDQVQNFSFQRMPNSTDGLIDTMLLEYTDGFGAPQHATVPVEYENGKLQFGSEVSYSVDNPDSVDRE